MHSTVLIVISSTLKEDIGCVGVSLHKHEIEDDLRVGFPSNSIGILIALFPWQSLMMEIEMYRFISPSVLSCLRPIVSCTEYGGCSWYYYCSFIFWSADIYFLQYIHAKSFFLLLLLSSGGWGKIKL